jgi:hypothetical protein
MREQLLGYLLDALEDDERQQVEKHLGQDPQLARELGLLRRGLEPLAADAEHHEPPADLARRTCDFVAYRRVVVSMKESGETPSSWKLQDLAVAAGIFIAATLLLFPAVRHSRFQAQLAGCQENLRKIGFALNSYSQQHGQYFPYVPPKSKLATPGAYAPLLVEAGYYDNPEGFDCPGSDPAAIAERGGSSPAMADVLSAVGNQLDRLRQRMGGSYAMTIGHRDSQGEYQGTRNLQRPHFALLADSPIENASRFQSSNHGGKGQNVLFEDGHVEFLSDCRAKNSRGVDDIFLNDQGKFAPGLHVNDSVIGRLGLPIGDALEPATDDVAPAPK